MKKRKDARGKKDAGPGALALPPPVAPVRTRAQLRRFADDVVDFLNLKLNEAGNKHEEAADHVFKVLVNSDIARGLDPARDPTPEYLLVLSRETKSLDMKAGELAQHVKIGALNQLERSDAWDRMKWRKKVALLPLLALRDDRKKFHEGVQVAGRPNVGTRAVIAWVQAAVPRPAGSSGRPRRFTFAAGDQVIGAGVRLADGHSRGAFVKQVRTVEPERRRAFTKGLKSTIANLQKLVDEIEGPDED